MMKMSKIKDNVADFSTATILLLVSTLGVMLLTVVYLWAYDGTFYNILFWIGVLLFGIPIFFVISDKKVSQNQKIFVLFLFGLVLYIMRILPSTTNFRFSDELFHYETTNLIYEIGNLNISPDFDISKYYPGLELLNLPFKYVINLDIFPSSKILIGIIHSLILVFIYLFLKEICFSDSIAAIGTFIYATNPLYVFFHALYSYESLGVFFLVILLYVISKMLLKRISISFSVLAIVVLLSLTVTHHLSSIMFILFMVILSVVQILGKTNGKIYEKKWLPRFTILSTTVIFGWMIYIATITITYLGQTFSTRFSKIFELSLFGGSQKDVFSSSLSYSILPNYEYVIDTFMYAPLLLLLAMIGVYYVKKERLNNIFIYTMIIYGPLLYMISLALIPTSGSELAQRTWGFSYIGLSFIVAIAISKMLNNEKSSTRILSYTAVIISIAIILIGGISIGDKPIHREPSLLYPKLSAGFGSMTTDVYSSASLFEEKFGRDNRMAGGMMASIIFNSYGNQNSEMWNSGQVFLPESIDDNASSYIKSFNIRYLIIDNRMLKYPPEGGSYFSNSKVGMLHDESFEKFNSNNEFEKFYDNGNINLYKIMG